MSWLLKRLPDEEGASSVLTSQAGEWSGSAVLAVAGCLVTPEIGGAWHGASVVDAGSMANCATLCSLVLSPPAVGRKLESPQICLKHAVASPGSRASYGCRDFFSFVFDRESDGTSVQLGVSGPEFKFERCVLACSLTVPFWGVLNTRICLSGVYLVRESYVINR